MNGQAISPAPFSAHLKELRQRLTIWALSLILGAGLGYYFREPILTALQQPLGQPLFYTSPAGGFLVVMKLSILVGICLSIPVFIYHLIRFLEPAMPKQVGGRLIGILFASFVLLSTGIAFAYFVSLPASLRFLGSVGAGNIAPLISANEYLTFVSAYLIAFGALFQLPLVLLFINRIRPLAPRRLLRHQRVVVLASFLLAAIITPTPDPFNQTLMAVPIIVLYELSVPLIWIANRRHTPKFSRALTLP